MISLWYIFFFHFRRLEETTTTDTPDINTPGATTDTTAEPTTFTKFNETERTTEDEGATASTTVRNEVTDAETEYKLADKMETMLYQDVANEEEKKKVYVNQKMKGM